VDTATTINPFSYLRRNAEADPRGVFFETVDQRMVNSDAATQVRKIAFELRLLGVRPGDLVALDLPETLSMVFTEAVFHEAATSTVLPRGYVSDGAFPIQWIFSSATEAPASQGGARVVAVDSEFLRRVDGNPEGISPREYASPREIGRVAFSSGTTGQANAIALPLEAMEFHAASSLTTWMVGEPSLVFLPTSTVLGFYGFYLSVKEGRPFWAVDAGDPASSTSTMPAIWASSAPTAV
jgi:long-chain acyl-CoA synthetase